MSIERIMKLRLTCDNCGESVVVDVTNEAEAREVATRIGWWSGQLPNPGRNMAHRLFTTLKDLCGRCK